MVVRARVLLGTESDIEVIAEAETGRQAVAMTRKFRPAVVVMDITMPLLNGLEAARQIHDTAELTRYAIAAGIIESSVQLIVI